jgi:glycogen operon protein
MSNEIHPGKSFPIGATTYDHGVNFCVFSRNAEYIELLLFDHVDHSKPARIIRLDPNVHRTFYYWHVFIEGLKPGQVYAYRVYSSKSTESWNQFDPRKILTDPYARAIVSPKNYSRQAAIDPGNNCEQAMKCVVTPKDNYDWEGDEPLKIPYSESIIYELHVKGFTQHESSGVTPEKRGTYAGLIEKIPYLKQLGITAVELMPVYQFDEQDAGGDLTNYWGYSPVNFFSVHNGYGYEKDPLKLIQEFKDMVKAFHKAGIEVILDVVFNHTAEAGEEGPVFNLKGFGNDSYYLLKSNGKYRDYTGCGNTLNANHSILRRMIRHSLRYWAEEMHIDGFRFDLASVLSRDESGKPLKNPPVLWEIESVPSLAHVKLIAEAWDAGGLYQVGSFIGERWAEWNGQYRDDVRKFVKGEKGIVKKLASRILGSPDIYPDPAREPNRSINFITCHDGFTMNDLVSFNEKHNEANLEGGRDGSNFNDSWNCGVEGPSENADIDSLRVKQIKNFFTILFISQGTPMLSMGDEIRRTQSGNNNAYCQDNNISWMDWNLLVPNSDLHTFVKNLISFVKEKEIFKLEKILTAKKVIGEPHLMWHGTKPNHPDWQHYSRSLAFSLTYPNYNEFLYVIMNSYWKGLSFVLPKLKESRKWYPVVDTHKSYPEDFSNLEKSKGLKKNLYKAAPRSVVVFWGK